MKKNIAGSTLLEILITLTLLGGGFVWCLLSDLQRQHRLERYQHQAQLRQQQVNQYEQCWMRR